MSPTDRDRQTGSVAVGALRQGKSQQNFLSRLWRRFEFGPLLGLATALMLLSTGIMLFEVVGRGIFNTSYFWAEEAVRYLMVWAFFLSLGVTGTTMHHIRTDLLVDRVSRYTQNFMHVVACLAGVAFSGILLVSSLPQVQRYYTMGMMTESNLDLPMWVLFLALPIGASLLLVYYLIALGKALRGKNPFASHGVTGSEL